MQIIRINKVGQVVIPAPLRKKYSFANGGFVSIEEAEDGILLRPVVVKARKNGRRSALVTSRAPLHLQKSQKSEVWTKAAA